MAGLQQGRPDCQQAGLNRSGRGQRLFEQLRAGVEIFPEQRQFGRFEQHGMWRFTGRTRLPALQQAVDFTPGALTPQRGQTRRVRPCQQIGWRHQPRQQCLGRIGGSRMAEGAPPRACSSNAR